MRFKFLSKDKISQLPKNPGVYTLKNGREFLYIGKAANIKERVKNHFQQTAYRDNLFVNQVKKIGHIKTDSEIEALILEANLIKKYQPKYNVVWRDDKNYFYVGIAKEDFSRVFITHQPAKIFASQKLSQASPKSIYVGPFVDGKALKQVLKILRKVFPYRSCKTLPKRPCLWYQLGRCPGPCLLRSGLAKQIPLALSRMKKECQQNVKNILKILKGRKSQVLKDLKREMKKASLAEDFEKAAKIRDQIAALEKILAHAKILSLELPENVLIQPWQNYYVKRWKKTEQELKKIINKKGEISRIEAYDVSNIQGQQAAGSMVTFLKGLPDKNFYRRFKIKISGKPNDIGMIKEVLNRRFRHPEWPFPDLILIDGGKAQLNTALQCLRWKLKHFKQPIRIMALAKKKNELFIEGQKRPILLKNLPREIFNLILQLRDEAHRFALTYHKKLRKVDLLPRL